MVPPGLVVFLALVFGAGLFMILRNGGFARKDRSGGDGGGFFDLGDGDGGGDGGGD